MKNSLRVVALLILVLALQGLVSCASTTHNEVQAPILDPDPKWSMCTKRTDCAIIEGFCKVPAAVNRKYISNLKDHIAKSTATYDCKPYSHVNFGRSTKVGCEKRKCSLVFE